MDRAGVLPDRAGHIVNAPVSVLVARLEHELESARLGLEAVPSEPVNPGTVRAVLALANARTLAVKIRESL